MKAIVMKNSEYWRRRVIALEESQKQKVDKYLAKLNKSYRKAFYDIQKELEAFYYRYAVENQVSLTDAQAVLNNKELEQWKITVDQYMKMARSNENGQYTKQLKRLYVKTRVDRLQALQTDIVDKVENLYKQYENDTNDLLIDSFRGMYYHNMYEIHKTTGVAIDFALVNDELIKSVVNYQYYEGNFSSRLYTDRKQLITNLKAILTDGFEQGTPLRRMASNLDELIQADYKNAKRLVRTEANFFMNQASFVSYEQADIQKFEFVATLDIRTSEKCRNKDRKVFYLKDMQVGVNCPPLHPYCRSTTIPYFDVDYMSRISRYTGKVRGDITYKQWYKRYVVNQNVA